MWQWLNSWQSAIGRLQLGVKQPVVKELPPPPTTLLSPVSRAAVTQALPHPLAVDLLESSLFYRSIEGKIVCRSIASGAIEWESKDNAYPLRVSDHILWAVQGDAIAAYATTDGQLLMRSQPLWLPGGATHTLCDLSQQTLRIYAKYSPPPNTGVWVPHYPNEDAAAYEVSLISGEVTTLYQCTLRCSQRAMGDEIIPRLPDALRSALESHSIDELDKPRQLIEDYRGGKVSRDELSQRLKDDLSERSKAYDELLQRIEDYRGENRKAYHWPAWQEVESQFYGGRNSRMAELKKASVVVFDYSVDQSVKRRTALRVSSNQPPYTEYWQDPNYWQVTLKEFCLEIPRC
ncbi:hypothetical protein JOY44_28740 (plasmid) [Phormidium sp. CLA17]|uniref:hypothetical protein n=1 Tax=Leptolyngbya sp. Cla-17 TaxID=2803751 RepID=UPI0019325D5D|nr:hypothetical protein [Leptolyngbya sp. Cla-17]MBM0745415.1 hypothetical protein [Leptolyngbya sp. Cla-17]